MANLNITPETPCLVVLLELASKGEGDIASLHCFWGGRLLLDRPWMRSGSAGNQTAAGLLQTRARRNKTQVEAATTCNGPSYKMYYVNYNYHLILDILIFPSKSE